MTGSVPDGCKLPSRLSELRAQPPRPLTVQELQRLNRLGFTSLAKALAAGTCDRCGMNKTGTGHRQMCVEPEQAQNPEPAREQPAQPWEPRPSRHQRNLAA